MGVLKKPFDDLPGFFVDAAMVTFLLWLMSIPPRWQLALFYFICGALLSFGRGFYREVIKKQT